ncbi:type II secretion system F family protein [Aurantimonas endophytica]|uniref:Tight adherence protein C n=1 Tax=Aurantimonas endophytica TaxID=1522175 RepID=A0A7W6HCG7_9HYPH|nr:type II secretion system F family protein [Aurantimonas endophytica]MBB4002684.1 tight adherence protein C [Aurantimonas endophytica]MCO6403564.1 type II secretion system F family protein [Aurantimonas endophytica]
MQSLFDYLGVSSSLVLSTVIAIAVFTTFLALAMPMLSGNRLQSRMRSVALERDEMRARERARLASEKENGRGAGLRQQQNRGIAALVVERLNLRTALADEGTVASLRVAGYRGQRAMTLFLFARVVLPLVMLAAALFYVFGLGLLENQGTMMRVAACIGIAYLGFYAPILFVKNQAAKRRLSIQRAWPDALDLLLICVESGNSIEAAFRRVAEEIGIQSIPLAEELVLVCAELSYLPDRKVAYDNLAARTGLEGVRAVTTALVQAERYGTPLGNALRVLAQENRDMRMNLAEKKAASLPPKLTVPMILFFLPVLFVVIIGPAAIQIMKLQ